MDSDQRALNEVLNQFAASICGGDFEHWMSLWAEEGVQMAPNAPTLVGKTKVKESMNSMFETLDLELVIHEIEDTKVFGEIGLTRCRYSLKGTPKDGGETIEFMPDGKALTLYRKKSDGSWKIIYDCFNSSI